MKFLRSAGLALFTLVVMLVASTHAAEGGSRVNADVGAIQSEIQNAQRAFTRVRDSKGSDTREFDVAITRLRLRINALSASLKSEKQVSGATSRGAGDSPGRLNVYFRSLEKARAQSDWRAVERDLDRLDSYAKELHSAAIKIPGEPGAVSRTPPKPPATGPGGSPGVTVTPKPKPGSKPRTVNPYKPPPPTRRGPGPKGPDDPRFVVAPAPPVPPYPDPDDTPDPPPPPDDPGTYNAMPLPGKEPAGKGSPPMMRKPARPPVRLQDDFPKPKPVSLQNGTKLYFGTGGSGLRKPGLGEAPVKPHPKIPATLSRARISEAMNQVRRAYNLEQKSTHDPGSAPFIVMSPRKTRGTRHGMPSDNDYYNLINGDHTPYPYGVGGAGAYPSIGYDRVKCEEVSSDSPIGASSYIRFTIQDLDDDKIYLADITVSAPTWVINDELVDASGGHILYAFTAADLSWDWLFLKCGDPAPYSGQFHKIEIYKVN